MTSKVYCAVFGCMNSSITHPDFIPSITFLDYLETERNVTRYHQVILRAEFDKNKNVSDPKERRRLLWVGEHELFLKINPLRVEKFPHSIGNSGGGAVGRAIEPPDWVIDYWHPLEKAHFPEYFRKREARKCEYIQKWHLGQLY